jgi:DNA-binding protein YbaB
MEFIRKLPTPKEVKEMYPIDEELAKDDLEMVQDMLVIAFNEANKKIEAETQKSLGGFGGGFPGLF